VNTAATSGSELSFRHDKMNRFEGVVMVHLDAAYNLARWLARDDDAAKDIAQEACLRALKFFDTFRGENARPWLLAIVRNTYYDWIAKNRPRAEHVPFDEEVHTDYAGPEHGGRNGYDNIEHILQQEDSRRAVKRALDQLPPEFREIMVLRELEDMSYKDIAQIAKIPIGTVMSRLSRARRMMLESLRRAGLER
jgi:RNA polymerase sigma factor (sigma-70 family)